MSVPGKQRTKHAKEKYMYAKAAVAMNDADNINVVSPRDLLLEEIKFLYLSVNSSWKDRTFSCNTC